MKFPALAAILVAALFSLFTFLAGPAAATASERYVCKPTFLGMCKTVYAGEVSPAAAELYVQQARDLVFEVTGYPETRTAHYYPKKDLLVLEEEPGHNITPKMLTQVTKLFVDRRLFVDRGIIMHHGMRWVRFSKDVRIDKGGHSRFLALAKQPVTADGPLQQNGRRAIDPVKTDSFGNIALEFSR